VLLLMQVKKNPKPPSDLVPDIPLNLERAILKALAKQPEARFESAGAMSAALAASMGRKPQTIETDSAETEQVQIETASQPEEARPGIIRVALADDHRILRTSLAVYLDENAQMEVVGEADNGEQALEIVREKHPDVLLLDLNMPGTSGLDILPEIRRTWPEVKVLVLTGRDEDMYIMRALRAGAHGYILKTTDEDALVQAVRDVAAGHLVLGHGVAERVAQGFMTREPSSSQQLSDLDRAILTGIAAGMTNDQIAERLKVDPQIIAAQLMMILEQLGAKSRTEAALLALRKELIMLEDLHNF